MLSPTDLDPQSRAQPADFSELAEIRAAASRNGLSAAQTTELLTAIESAAPEHRQLLCQTVLAQLTRKRNSASAAEPQVLSPLECADEACAASTTTSPAQAGPAREESAKLQTVPPAVPTAQDDGGATGAPTVSAATPPAAPREPDAAECVAAPPATPAAGESNPASGATSPAPVVQRPAATISVTDDKDAVSPRAAPPSGVSVEPASPPLPWRKQVREAIVDLRDRLSEDSLDDEDRARLQTYLALLHLVADEHEKAVESLPEYRSEEELEFWRQQLLGMSALLKTEDVPKFRYRVETATHFLRQGTQALAALGPLRVKNLAFCTKVSGFGDLNEFDTYVFRPGQQVLLYVEVENYTVELVETGGGAHATAVRTLGGSAQVPMYETELHGRYEILDATQRPVASRTLPPDRNRCRNHRSDYFIPYMLYMPEQIASGTYTLELVLEDKKGDKYGSGVIEFRIK